MAVNAEVVFLGYIDLHPRLVPGAFITGLTHFGRSEKTGGSDLQRATRRRIVQSVERRLLISGIGLTENVVDMMTSGPDTLWSRHIIGIPELARAGSDIETAPPPSGYRPPEFGVVFVRRHERRLVVTEEKFFVLIVLAARGKSTECECRRRARGVR